jgi:N-succinyl-L-ornithine transcarbamylase
MDGDKSEQPTRGLIPVMAHSTATSIGVRSCAQFESRKDDYEEVILNQFIRYSGRPVFFMESATVLSCRPSPTSSHRAVQSATARPKVVLTWAHHPKALRKPWPNSFAEWMNAADVDFVVTHPEGYELDPQFVGDARVAHDQRKAFEGADFIYAKTWACPGVTRPEDYGKVLSKDMSGTVDTEHMAWTNNAFFMHCLPCAAT